MIQENEILIFKTYLTDEQHMKRNRNGRLPFCDCTECHTANEIKGKGFIVTTVNKDGYCRFCGYQVVWTKPTIGTFKGYNFKVLNVIADYLDRENKKFVNFNIEENKKVYHYRVISKTTKSDLLKKREHFFYELTDQGFDLLKQAGYI